MTDKFYCKCGKVCGTTRYFRTETASTAGFVVHTADRCRDVTVQDAAPCLADNSVADMKKQQANINALVKKMTDEIYETADVKQLGGAAAGYLTDEVKPNAELGNLRDECDKLRKANADLGRRFNNAEMINKRQEKNLEAYRELEEKRRAKGTGVERKLRVTIEPIRGAKGIVENTQYHDFLLENGQQIEHLLVFQHHTQQASLDFDANVLPRLLNILSKKFAKNTCLVISLHPGQEFTVCDIKR